jgi:hypothetical protein
MCKLKKRARGQTSDSSSQPGAHKDFDIGLSTNVEPVTVMVLDERGLLQESRKAYDKKVAGVISGAGKFKHGLILGRDKGQSDSHRATVARALQRVSAGQKGLIPLLVALQ